MRPGSSVARGEVKVLAGGAAGRREFGGGSYGADGGAIDAHGHGLGRGGAGAVEQPTGS